MIYFFSITIIIIQLIFLFFYLIKFFSFVHNRKSIVKKLEKIDKKDKEKFKYYRELLNNYTISELCYLYNGKKNKDLLIMSELEWLVVNNYIVILDNEIRITIMI